MFSKYFGHNCVNFLRIDEKLCEVVTSTECLVICEHHLERISR
jgi:hypothetical protein